MQGGYFLTIYHLSMNLLENLSKDKCIICLQLFDIVVTGKFLQYLFYNI